jgi:hypothetical protein
MVDACDIEAGDMLAVTFDRGPVRVVVVAGVELIPGDRWMDIVSDDGRRWQVGRCEMMMVADVAGAGGRAWQQTRSATQRPPSAGAAAR